MPYRFPKSMILLDAYLRQHGRYDVDKISSDRHALDLLRKATGLKVMFPPRGKSCYSQIRRVHEQLFPLVPLKKAPSKARRVHGIGLTGPASDCRTVPQNSKEWAAIVAHHETAARHRVAIDQELNHGLFKLSGG